MTSYKRRVTCSTFPWWGGRGGGIDAGAAQGLLRCREQSRRSHQCRLLQLCPLCDGAREGRARTARTAARVRPLQARGLLRRGAIQPRLRLDEGSRNDRRPKPARRARRRLIRQPPCRCDLKFVWLSLFGEQFQRLDAGLGQRRGAQLQQKAGSALPDDARALIVIVLDAGGDDGAGDAQRSLPVFVKGVHFRAFFNKKLNNRVDSLVSRSVKGGPFVLTGRIDIGS